MIYQAFGVRVYSVVAPPKPWRAPRLHPPRRHNSPTPRPALPTSSSDGQGDGFPALQEAQPGWLDVCTFQAHLQGRKAGPEVSPRLIHSPTDRWQFVVVVRLPGSGSGSDSCSYSWHVIKACCNPPCLSLQTDPAPRSYRPVQHRGQEIGDEYPEEEGRHASPNQ